jgi:hypothetical protein
MNYCIGHNPQVISQLSRDGLIIAVDGEIARYGMLVARRRHRSTDGE